MPGPFIAPQPTSDKADGLTGSVVPSTGLLVAGNVVSSAPTLVAGNLAALYLTTAGRLIVDGSQVTQPVSGTVAVTQSTSPWVDNITQWNGIALGSPSSYGTSPGAVNVIGVNAFVTNTVPVTLTSTTVTNTVAENLTQVGGSSISLGQATMAASLPVVIASNQSPIPVTQSEFFSTNTYTITTTGTQTAVNISTTPLKTWSISVKGTGASATSWSVNLEISLDGTNFTTLLTHTNTTETDGSMLVSGTALAPALYYRVNTTALSLGSATNIVVVVLGV